METRNNLFFEEVFKMSPDLMMISRVEDAKYIAINNGFTNLLGYTKEEVLEKSSLELCIWVEPLDRKKIAEEIRKYGIVQNYESKFRAKNATIVPVLLSASQITINRIAYFVGIAKDISELKQKEKIILEREEKFLQLSELAPVGIYLTDNSGQCIYVNAKWREMSGLSMDHAKGSGWINGIHPEDRKNIFDNWNKMITEDGNWGLEYRFKNHEGKITWVYGVASPRKDNVGKTVGYVGVNVDITEKKISQESIKNYQLLLQSSLEAQKDTILFSIDKEYRYLYFNKAHQESMKFAYNQDIAIGMNVLSYMSNEQDRVIAKENFNRSLQGESHTNIRVFGDTNLAYYESFFNPICNEKGEIIGVTALSRDVTNRIEIQEKERTANLRLNFAMQIAGMAWWEMDLQSHGVTFERRKAEMLGYSPEQFTKYEDFMALVHPDDYENTMNAMRKHLEGKLEKYEVEYRIKSSSGEYRWFYDIGSIVKRDDDGKPLLVTGLVIDISEQTFSKNALVYSEKKFRDLFSTMLEGFAYHQIITNENNEPIDYIFLEINEAFEKLTGLNRDLVIGKKVSQVLPGTLNDPANWVKRYGEVALTGKSITFESYHQDLKKWYQISAYSHKIGYFAVLFQDISERKLAEIELKNFNTHLEEKVQKRTSELENSIEAMKSFSYTVSHDLRAPLRAINGFSSILSSTYHDQLGEEGNRLLRIIRENATRMNQLISGLLELAKATNEEIKKRPIEMNSLVNEVYQEIVSETDQPRIDFILSPLLDCVGEPFLIKQVWSNLIANAVKFTQKKEKAIIAIQSYQDKNQIVYQIRDNGAGFNAEYINKLFVAFQRLHSEEEFAGSGIGLSIVDRIIKRHGGRVWAEGIEGQGATFYFSLPKKDKDGN